MNPTDMMNYSGDWMDGGMMLWVVTGIIMVILMILVLIKWLK